VTRKLIYLPLLLLIASCTITKRVHRPGYHIQWRKIERTTSPVHSTKIHPNPTTIQTDDEEFFPNEELTLTADNPVQDSPKEASAPVEEPSNSINLTEPLTNIPLEKSSSEAASMSAIKASTSDNQTTMRPIFWRVAPSTLRKLGVVLIILGILILFGSLLVHAGAFSSGGGNTGEWFSFFIDLLNISNWFWLLFVILILLLVFWLFFLIVLHLLV